MKKLVLAITLVLIAPGCFFAPSFVWAERCDKDPLCVVSLVYEGGLMLKYDGLEEYTCKEKVHLIEKGKSVAKVQVEKKKSQGIDFYKQAKFDFSNIDYNLSVDGKEGIVFVSGFFIGTLDGTDFEYKGKVDSAHVVKKENNDWKWCGYKSLKPKTNSDENM